MRKFLCLVLSLSTLFCFTFGISTSATDLSNPNVYCSGSFFDADGKANTIITEFGEDNSVIVKHYVDNIMIMMATTSALKDVYITELKDYTSNESSNPQITFITTNKRDFESVTFTSPDRAYSYMGTIRYNPVVTQYGTANYKLNVLHQYVNNVLTTYTINKPAGTAVSVIISLLCAAIDFFNPSWGTPLIRFIVDVLGGEIVGGLISVAISKTVAAYKYTYDVKAVDTDTNREMHYYGYRYKVAENTTGYSKTYYEGYYPYGNTTVAYWMYCDFWEGSNYPGVYSF